MAARPVVRVLAFGDSLTEGWCDFGTKFHPYTRKVHSLIQSLSKSVDVVNRGVSGETTDQMREGVNGVNCLAYKGLFSLS